MLNSTMTIQTNREKFYRFTFSFQTDVEAESAEILKLGLLFGEEIDVIATNVPAMFSFHHKLIHEYMAAVYIADNIKQDESTSFLTDVFPTLELMKDHREVLHFICGMPYQVVVSRLTNHVAKVLSEGLLKEMQEGKADLLYRETELLYSLLREGNVSNVKPYVTWYPECEHPLAEVLKSTRLAYITGIDQHDPLQLDACNTQIILNFNLEFQSGVSIWSLQVSKMEELACSIENLNQQRQLTYCKITAVNKGYHDSFLLRKIPKSLLSALARCQLLRCIDLQNLDLHGKLCTLMADLPPALRKLRLECCSLNAEDIAHMTEAFEKDKFTRLEELNIRWNPISESALNALLKVISIKPYELKCVRVFWTGDCTGPISELPLNIVWFSRAMGGRQEMDGCINKWQTKLKNIKLETVS